MRVLVCGGLDFTDEIKLRAALDMEDRRLGIDVLIHGGAPGADTLAARWGRDSGKKVIEYKADWKKHGRSAGPIRNRQMLNEGNPDIVIAFAGGRGTEDMIRKARADRIPVQEIW